MSFSGLLSVHGGLDTAGFENSPTPGEHLGCRVLFQGSIANRSELVRRLGIAGDQSNTVVLATAYRTFGIDLPVHVLGEYAAVIHAPASGQALLTHDSMGLAPLYIYECQEGLFFATHLIDMLDATANFLLDEEYLADYIALGVITSERTPFLGIRRLMPGRSLRWSNGRLSETVHWSLAAAPSLSFDSEEATEERFRQLLEAAVRGAMVESNSVWTHLSGGLDSSSVACMAAKLGAPRLAAYSAYAPNLPRADERRWMREVIDCWGMPWYSHNIETTLPFAEPPGAFLGEPAVSVISEAQSRSEDELFSAHGVETMLTGYGGDDVLGAFQGPVPMHLADPLFACRPLAALRGIEAWRVQSGERRSRSYWILRGLAEPAFRHALGLSVSATTLLPLQGWISWDYARKMRLEKRRSPLLAPRCRTPSLQQLADNLLIASLQMSLAKQRRPSGASLRSPLMYRPLVEFMAGLPADQHLQPRCDRFLQRRALKGILPEAIRRRAGKGVGSAPIVEGLARSPEWVDYLTKDSRMANLGIADPANWKQSVRQASLGQTHGDQFFLAGVAVEVWLRQLEEHKRRRSKTIPA
jgi:asparagine synthase (glutamine-hydrolysing)